MALIGMPAVAGAAVKDSNQFAGFAYPPNYVGSSMVVKSTIVVPKLTCGSAFQGVTASVGTEAEIGTKTTGTLAGVVLGCQKGKAYYFPTINVNSPTSHNYVGVHFHPGDKVLLSVSENTDATLVSVKDTTRNESKTLTGGGATKVGYPWVGDEAQNVSTGFAPVPDFGTIHYSAATVNGQSLGSLSRFNRANAGTLQIETTALGSGGKSFSTIYKHS